MRWKNTEMQQQLAFQQMLIQQQNNLISMNSGMLPNQQIMSFNQNPIPVQRSFNFRRFY